MNTENNQNNNIFWLSLGLVGGAITVYWLMKDKSDKKGQELSQVNQEKEQELKKIQEKVQELEQQLAKLNEEWNKKSNHSNQGLNFWSSNLISGLSQWLKKKLLN
jgi:uncharacterized FlaG/YvyC family protein